MSSSQIPNLLTSRRGPRLRGRGGGRGHGHVGASASSRRDQTVQSTDTDAAVSRLSAVSLNYLDDPFAQYFVSGTGTYTRTTALDTLVDAFLSLPNLSSQPKQIISLGAGTDTRYFRLRAKNQHRGILYHEFDFPTVCAAKRRIVEANIPVPEGEVLFPDRIANSDGDDAEWGILASGNEGSEPRYTCHPLDLRQLPSLESPASLRGLRTDVPTLIISECCLCYLDVDVATSVIKWFADRMAEVGIVLYEPIGPDDAFGQMMTENLAARGITMPTLRYYKTLDQQRERLANLGFREEAGGGGNDAVSIEYIWEGWVTEEERERVDSLEGLDEVEEWQMLARHYAITWGWKGSIPFKSWAVPQVSAK